MITGPVALISSSNTRFLDRKYRFRLDIQLSAETPQVHYNVRHPLKDPSSEEFVFGVEPVIDISLSDSTPKTNSSELRSLSGRLTLYRAMFKPTFSVVSDHFRL